MQSTDQDNSYSVYWTLTIKIYDSKGVSAKNTEVTIRDRNNSIIMQSKTNESGILSAELQQYAVDGKGKKVSSPYTIIAGKLKKEIDLDNNKEITLQ